MRIGKTIACILLVAVAALCTCACSGGNPSNGNPSSGHTALVSEQELVGQWKVVKIEDRQGNVQYEREADAENGAEIEFWHGNRCQYTLPGSQTKGTWEIDETGAVNITLAEAPPSQAKIENGKLIISDDAYIMSCEKAA